MNTSFLKYIAYFDIFDHPLTIQEISDLSLIPEQELISLLEDCERSGKVFSFDNYYSLQKNVQQLVLNRRDRVEKAALYFEKLPRYAKIIRSFPFVKGIGISGSLSKNVMHENGDIDYFIITSEGRLWICRTMLVAFKKIFLFNSRKYFCVNYFVDENNLEIIDKNIFTAIETSYLLPVYNYKLISEFKKMNAWSTKYLPEFKQPIQVQEIKQKKGLINRMIEFILKGKIGDHLDLYLMELTYRRWEKKFKHFDSKKFELTMRTNRGVSKHHPRDFQTKVLAAYNTRLDQLGIQE